MGTIATKNKKPNKKTSIAIRKGTTLPLSKTPNAEGRFLRRTILNRRGTKNSRIYNEKKISIKKSTKNQKASTTNTKIEHKYHY